MYDRRPSVDESSRIATYEKIKNVMSDQLFSISLDRYSASEYSSRRKSRIVLNLTESPSSKGLELSGTGSGLIDAGYGAMLKHYSKQHKSLNNIKFHSFWVGQYKPDKYDLKSSSQTETIIELKNSSGKIMPFRKSDKSSLFSSLKCVVSAFTFYINSEMAFLKLRGLIEDARQRGRSDLEQIYVGKISEIVRITSYEDL